MDNQQRSLIYKELKMEIWKTVIGFENYEISNLGNLRNKITGRYKKLSTNKEGYIRTSISNKEKVISIAVHRLVAIEFVENPEGKPLVNHKDSNRSNNKAENLEWATPSENAKYMVEQGNSLDKNGVLNPMALLTEEQVLEIREFDGPSAILAKKFNISTNAIDRVRVRDSYKNVGGRILPKGSRNTENAHKIHRKLTDEQVLEIRQNTESSNRKLAKEFGVAKSTIEAIKNFKTYKHIVL